MNAISIDLVIFFKDLNLGSRKVPIGRSVNLTDSIETTLTS